MKTATCKKCGIREPATYASNNYRCASCESETERENRLLKEENAALRRVLMGAK